MPPEIRLEIYELLWDTQPQGAKKLEITNAVQSSFAFTLPITRVNRRIRYESIPVFYSAIQLVISFNSEKRLHRCRQWLDIVDPLALKQICSYKLNCFLHYCRIPGETFYKLGDRTSIDLGEDKAVLTSARTNCYSAKRAEDEQRRAWVKEFVEERDGGKGWTKKDVLELVEIVGALNTDESDIDSTTVQVGHSPAR